MTPQDALKAVEERRKKKGLTPPPVPFLGADGKEEVLPTPKKRSETLGEVYDRRIREQGGWGLSDDTRQALGGDNASIPEVLRPVTDLTANVADLGYRALQGLQAGIETGAEKADELSESSGLADKLSVGGNRFMPGSAVMALMEAFPAGGAEAGITPRFGNPAHDVVAPEVRARLTAEADDLLKKGATREEFDAWTSKNNMAPYGKELDEALAARDVDLDHVLSQPAKPRPTEYLEPNIPESVHPDDAFLVPPKGGLESGRGMDEREIARYNKKVWQEKQAQGVDGPANSAEVIPANDSPIRQNAKERLFGVIDKSGIPVEQGLIDDILDTDISFVPQEFLDNANAFGTDQLEDIVRRLSDGEPVSLADELAKAKPKEIKQPPEAANDALIGRPTAPRPGATNIEWADYHAEDAAYNLMKADKLRRRGKERHAATAENIANISMRQASRRNPEKYGKPSEQESAAYFRQQAEYHQNKMNQRAAAGDAKGLERHRLFRDDAANKAGLYAEVSLQKTNLKTVSDDDLLAMDKTPEVLDEFRRRNREQFGQEPVRGGDEIDPTAPVPQGKKVGGIGKGQNVVPDELAHFSVEKQTPRSREATQAAASAVNFGEDGRIGDVSAIAAKGAAETRMAAHDVMRAYQEHGPGIEYEEAVTRFEKTAGKHSQNSSELGRGLQTLAHGGASKEEIAKFTELASDPGKADKFGKLVERYKDDPDALRKIARDGTNPSIRDRIFSFRYNMMLSGPKTHFYNIVGNTANVAVDVAEHGLASVLGQFRKLAGNTDRVSGREVGARLIGATMGARQGLKNMKAAYREGRPLDDANRAEMLHGKVGPLQVPVKAMAAEDEFFRSVAAVSNTYGKAVRIATEEGLTGDALKNRIDDLIKDPTADMIKDTGDYSKRMRFQDDPSALGKMIEGARTRKPGMSVGNKLVADAITLVLPFVRTPDSLVRTAIRRSPLGILDNVNIQDFKAGGARRDLAIARVAMGSGVTALVASKVLGGMITGEGPRDYKKRQALELTGWQPNSIKIGDKYYSYEGLEPLSIVLGGTATAVERADEGSGKGYVEKAATQAANAAEVLVNQSWAENLSDLFDALDAPPGQRQAAVNNFFANIGQSFVVPAAVRQVNAAYIDPMTRDTRGDDSMADRVKNRIISGIPGMSDDLPAQVDALGRELGHGDAIGPDILSRASTTLAQNTPVASELKRLMGSDPEGKALLGRVDRSVNTSEFPIGRLTSLEHHNYQVSTGAYFTALMNEALASPEWKKMSDDDKRAEVKEMAADARKWAREDTFGAPEDAKKGGKGAEKEEPAEKGQIFEFGIPTSGLRSPAKNAKVGGVANSDHLDGDGMDFVPAEGVSWGKLYAEAKRFFGPTAKVIHEKPGYRHGAYHREHVHVSSPGLNAPAF